MLNTNVVVKVVLIRCAYNMPSDFGGIVTVAKSTKPHTRLGWNPGGFPILSNGYKLGPYSSDVLLAVEYSAEQLSIRTSPILYHSNHYFLVTLTGRWTTLTVEQLNVQTQQHNSDWPLNNSLYKLNKNIASNFSMLQIIIHVVAFYRRVRTTMGRRVVVECTSQKITWYRRFRRQ